MKKEEFGGGVDRASDRKGFIELLRRYEPLDERDAETKGRFLRFVTEEPHCFERSCAPGHVTGSAFIVDERGSHTLLTHHRKLGKWLQLGGHVDGSSDVAMAALREAEEESGLEDLVALDGLVFDLDIHEIPARGSEPSHLHYDARFLFVASRENPLVVSDESHALAWVPLAELERATGEWSVLRMREKWLRHPCCPELCS